LTQDIFDGCWNLNPQTKLLIEKEYFSISDSDKNFELSIEEQPNLYYVSLLLILFIILKEV